MAFFAILMIAIFTLQYFLVGSLVSLQQVTTEAGNSNSAVIGILPDTEVIRQKFCFDRRVVLNSFSITLFLQKEQGRRYASHSGDGRQQ